MTADLHCHSTVSDGSTDVEDILKMARLKEIGALSVTDHDTFIGSEIALKHAKEYDVEIIHGAEISAFDNKRNRLVHILCYMCDNPSMMDGVFTDIAESRRKSIDKALDKIIDKYPITREMVEKHAKNSTTIFKSHVMQTLMNAGLTDKVYGDLYRELFNWKTGIVRTKIEYPDVYDILSLIHKAGGIAVLAHPGVYDSIELLPELARAGLDGVECWYPRAKDGETEKITAIADEYNLVKTGGTDFHGYSSNMVNPIGTCTTPYDQLERLKKLKK